MILFVGNEEKGHFIRDVARLNGWTAEFVKANLDIEDQVKEILQYPECKVIVYDIEQYTNSASVIADVIRKIGLANNSKPVIYAPGFRPQSDVIMYLAFQGITDCIYSDTLTEKKEELQAAIDGKTSPRHVIEDKVEETEKQERQMAKAIGVAGAVSRMGTTTYALQLVKYLMFKGYKACYIEMNNHGYVKELCEAYEGVEMEELIGKAVYQEVEMYDKLEKLPEVLKRNYDFYVYDYGVYNDRDFNKISFLEKDLQIFLVGTKPGEFMRTYQLIENNFYNNVIYIFNFIRKDKQEQEDIYELMQDKSKNTYFAGDCRDPFILTEKELLEEILPLEQKINEETKKKGWFHGGKRKNNKKS